MSESRPDLAATAPTPVVQALTSFVLEARWFGGKGRGGEITGVRRLAEVSPGSGADDDPRVVVELVEVGYPDGGSETYQVPLALYTDAQHRLDHAFVGWWEEPDSGWVHAYDAAHDRLAMSTWLDGFVAAGAGEQATVAERGGLAFHRLPGHDLDPDATASLFSGEQSNSSVFFGEDALLKLFRKLTPGINPDVEIHRLLTDAGSEHVAALYGWIEAAPLESQQAAQHETEHATGQPGDTPPLQLGMLQQFLRTATDGWDIALASVRNLFAEADLHAAEVGGDFAGEASRLGEALRDIHEVLRERAPLADGVADSVTPSRVAAGMAARLDDALEVVPELHAHADALRAVYDRLADLPEVNVQRVHGDLHLGQTLRTARGWKIVDFEGEPAKPLAERTLPDSRWRDVAGMLRSLAYAPASVLRSHGDDPDNVPQLSFRADEWKHRNQNHFLVAYAGGALTDQQTTLLDAYAADKAVYECVYETRNRPTWVAIPLAAVAEIGARQ